MTTKMTRLRGLKALLQDMVDHGSRAVERVQIDTARRPFSILEAIPPVAPAAKLVRVVHDAVVSTTHVSVRAVNGTVGLVLDAVLDAVEENTPPPSEDAP